MKSGIDLATWLRGLSRGRASSVFTEDVADTSSVLREAAASGRAPLRVVSLTWPTVPALANELGLLVGALATAVPSFAPELYGRRLEQASAKWTQSTIEVDAQAIVRALPDVQGTACRRVLTAVARVEVPSLGKMAPAEQALQLALAIEPERLLVLIAVLAEPSDSEPLRSLAQGAEWLATNTRSRVALVLPASLATRHELDHVTYEACHFTDATDEVPHLPGALEPALEGSASSVSPSTVPKIDVSPVEGLPHPRSDAEKHLYEHIRGDSRLRGLFGYNRRVSTRAGPVHVVDLVWEQGHLVIEIDGEDHRGSKQFRRDRVRDLELLLTGYHVVRFTEGKVLDNTPWVLDQIRQLVDYCSKRESA